MSQSERPPIGMIIGNGVPQIRGRASGPQPEAQAMILRDLYKRYSECPFKPGEFVTPRKGFALAGEGNPYIVLEVNANADPDFTPAPQAGPGSIYYGARLDVRVACMLPGSQETVVIAFWAQSWQFERYTGAVPQEGSVGDDVED